MLAHGALGCGHGEHTARPLVARVEHLEIDHRVLELEGEVRFELEGDGLVETLAISERQEECPPGDQLAGKR
jgi:hypothetical protein